MKSLLWLDEAMLRFSSNHIHDAISNLGLVLGAHKGNFVETRPDTRLPKSRVGGQGPYLRSPDHLGRSSEVKEIKS